MMAQYNQPPLPPLPPPSIQSRPTSFINYPPPSPILPVYPAGQPAPPPSLGAPFQYVPPLTPGAQFPSHPSINGYSPAVPSGSNLSMMQSRPYPVSAPHSHPMTPAAPMLAQHTGQADYFSPYPYSTPSTAPSTESQGSGSFQPHHHLMTPGSATIPQNATFAHPHNLGIMIPNSSQPCTPLNEYPSKFGPPSAMSFQSPISPYQPSPTPFGHIHPSYMLSHSVSNPDLSTLPNEIKYHPQAMEYTSMAPPDPYALKRSESGTGLEEVKYLDFGGGMGGIGGPNGQGKRQRVAMACTYCRRRSVGCNFVLDALETDFPDVTGKSAVTVLPLASIANAPVAPANTSPSLPPSLSNPPSIVRSEAQVPSGTPPTSSALPPSLLSTVPHPLNSPPQPTRAMPLSHERARRPALDLAPRGWRSMGSLGMGLVDSMGLRRGMVLQRRRKLRNLRLTLEWGPRGRVLVLGMGWRRRCFRIMDSVRVVSCRM